MSFFSGAILICASLIGALVIGVEPITQASFSIALVIYALASFLFLLVNSKDKWWAILMICWMPPLFATLFLVVVAKMASFLCVFSIVFPVWVLVFIGTLMVKYEVAYDLLHIYRCSSCGGALPKQYASCKRCYPESK